MAWLSGWLFRKSHVINYAAGAGTLYQKCIKVHYGSGTDNSNEPVCDVYLNSNCRTDFQDLRFTDDDGTTLLDYWFENKETASTDGFGIFWVEVADNLSTVAATIYVYYGNASASSVSNIDNTFLFGDDFDGTVLDSNKWTANAYGWWTYSVSSGKIRFTNGGTEWIYEPCTSYKGNQHKAKQGGSDYLLPTNVAIRWKHEVANTVANKMGEFGIVLVDSSGYVRAIRTFTDANGTVIQLLKRSSYYDQIEGSGDKFADATASSPDTRINEITKLDTTIMLRDITDGADSSTAVSSTSTRFSIGGCLYPDYPFFDYADMFWVIVRKYVSPEPAHGTWGTAEAKVTYAETLSISDVVQKKSAKVFTESVSLSDFHIKKPAKLFTETLTLSDVHVKKPSKTFAETLNLSDVYSHVWVLYRTYSETLVLSDVHVKKPSKVFTESIALSDVHIKKPSKVFAETLTLSDVYSRVWTLYRTYAETLALSDVLEKKTFKTFLEELALSDVLEKKPSKTFMETLALSDVLQKKPAKTFAETLSLSDVLTKRPSKTFTETLLLSDVYSRKWTLYRAYLETLALSDLLSKKLSKEFLETFSLRDLPRTWVVNPLETEKLLLKLKHLEDVKG